MDEQPLPKSMTYGDLYDPTATITSQVVADRYFDRMVERLIVHYRKTRAEAEAHVRHDIGYYSGYFDPSVAQRMNRLFKTTHPIFGDSTPSPQDAFDAGARLVLERKRKRQSPKRKKT